MSTVVANPLPLDGVVDKLTPEQTAKLKELWTALLKIVDEAPKYGTDHANGVQVSNGSDPEKPRKQDPKGPLPYEAELRDARACLAKYGSTRFMDSFWRFINHDYADVMVLKFLRARKWQIGATLAMLVACMQWRIESDVEKIFALGEEGMKDAEGFIKQLEMGKAYGQGTDREGRPVCYIHVRTHKIFDQSAKALEDFVVFQMECLRSLLTYPNDKADIVFDMTGFGLSNMDWKCVYFILKCLEAYYPESLNCMMIHNAPWIFQGIWRVLGPMMDPVVRAKVQFTKNANDLKVHIHEKHLIKQLGGTSDWQWEYTPVVPGENAKMKDTARRAELQAERGALIAEFERVTRFWAASDDRTIANARRVLDNKLRIQSFALYPYVRGRSVYHRKGNIAGDGRVVFEYPGLEPEDAREVIGVDKSVEGLEREVEDAMREEGVSGVIGELFRSQSTPGVPTVDISS